MESESGAIQSIIDELYFRLTKDIKLKVKVVFLEVSLMNLILGISNEIKCEVKVVLLEV